MDDCYGNFLREAEVGGSKREIVNGTAWRYRLENGRAIVEGLYPEREAVRIPATLGGCRVVRLDDECINYVNNGYSHGRNGDNLLAVKIPYDVEEIGFHAIKSDNLLVLEIPDSVRTLDEAGAFDNGFRNLIHISAGSGLELKDEDYLHYSLDGCGELRTAIVGNQVGLEMFGLGCSVVYLKIRDGVTRIDHVPQGLRAISIPDSVVEIRDWAFQGCQSLGMVRLPDSLESIGMSGLDD